MSTPDPGPQPPATESNPTPEGTIEQGGEIGLIVGARSSGKTALLFDLAERWHKKNDEGKVFFLGPDFDGKPRWIHIVGKAEDVDANAMLIVDEAALPFGQRTVGVNTVLSRLMQICRHRNISMVFATLNSAALDIQVVRMADVLYVKDPSLLQVPFERGGMRKLINEAVEAFKPIPIEERPGYTFVITKLGPKMVRSRVPSFWRPAMSKMYEFAMNDVTEEAEKAQEGARGEDEDDDEDEVEANPNPATEANPAEAEPSPNAHEEEVPVVNPAGKLLGVGDHIRFRNSLHLDVISNIWAAGPDPRNRRTHQILPGETYYILRGPRPGKAVNAAGQVVDDRLVDINDTRSGPAMFGDVPLRLGNAVRVEPEKREAPPAPEEKPPEGFDTVKNWERAMRIGDVYLGENGGHFTAWSYATTTGGDLGTWMYLGHERGTLTRLLSSFSLKLISQAPLESTRLVVGDVIRMRAGVLPVNVSGVIGLPQRNGAVHPTLSVGDNLLRWHYTTESVRVIRDWGDGVYEARRGTPPVVVDGAFSWFMAEKTADAPPSPPEPAPAPSPAPSPGEFNVGDLARIKKGLNAYQVILDRNGNSIKVARKRKAGFYYMRVFGASAAGGHEVRIETTDHRGHPGVYYVRETGGDRNAYVLSFRELERLDAPEAPPEPAPTPTPEPEPEPEPAPAEPAEEAPPESGPQPTQPLPEESPIEGPDDEAPPEQTCPVDPRCMQKLKTVYEAISEFFVWSRPFDRDVLLSAFLLRNGSVILKGVAGTGKSSVAETLVMLMSNDVRVHVPQRLYSTWGYEEFFQWMLKTGMYGIAVMNPEKTPQDIFFHTDVAIEKYQTKEAKANPPPPQYAQRFGVDPDKLEVYRFDPRPREIVGARIKMVNEANRQSAEVSDAMLRLLVERQVEFRGKVFSSPLGSKPNPESVEKTLARLKAEEVNKDAPEDELRKLAEHDPTTLWDIDPQVRGGGQFTLFDYNPHLDLEGQELDRALLDRISCGIYLSAGDPGLRYSVLVGKNLAAKEGESPEPRERAWGRIRSGRLDPLTSGELADIWDHMKRFRMDDEVMAWVALLTNIPNMVIRSYQENAYFKVDNWGGKLENVEAKPMSARIDQSMMTFFPKAKEGASSIRGGQTGLNPLAVIDGLNRPFGARSAEALFGLLRAYRYLRSVVRGEKPASSVRIRSQADREEVVKDLLRLLPYVLDHRVNIGISAELQQSFLSTFDMFEHHIVPRILVPELTWNVTGIHANERAGLLAQMEIVMEVWGMMKSDQAATRAKADTPAKRRALFIRQYRGLRNNISEDNAKNEIAQGLQQGIGLFTYYMAAMAESLSEDVAALARPKPPPKEEKKEA